MFVPFGARPRDPFLARELAAVVVFALVTALVGACLAACRPPAAPTPAQAEALAAEIEAKDKADTACLTSTSTCEGYVACRRRVATAHGLRFTGRCVP